MCLPSKCTQAEKETVEKGLGANVVKSLCESIYHTKRHIYFDDLLQNGLYSCGTLRSNKRGFPTELKKTSKERIRKKG